MSIAIRSLGAFKSGLLITTTDPRRTHVAGAPSSHQMSALWLRSPIGGSQMREAAPTNHHVSTRRNELEDEWRGIQGSAMDVDSTLISPVIASDELAVPSLALDLDEVAAARR